MTFRSNWYESGPGRRGFSLGASSWSGLRWIITLTIAAFALQWLELNFLHSVSLTLYGGLRAWWARAS